MLSGKWAYSPFVAFLIGLWIYLGAIAAQGQPAGQEQEEAQAGSSQTPTGKEYPPFQMPEQAQYDQSRPAMMYTQPPAGSPYGQLPASGQYGGEPPAGSPDGQPAQPGRYDQPSPQYGQQAPAPQYGQPAPAQPSPEYGQIQNNLPYSQAPTQIPIGNGPPYGGYTTFQPQGAPQYQGAYGAPPQNYYNQSGYPNGPQVYGGRDVYAPAGLVLPISLETAISTQVAKPGDFIQAQINQTISLGGSSCIPSGSIVQGTVSDASAGRRLSRSGELSLQFNSLQLPDGRRLPISAHLMGNIGKYKDKGTGNENVYRGEGFGTKFGQTALRGGLGAGMGAGLGTAVGAIAGGGHGAGMGAWSGAAIGGGIGLADMLLRKGKDVIIPSGTQMQVQLDQPVDFGTPGGPPPQQYTGAF